MPRSISFRRLRFPDRAVLHGAGYADTTLPKKQTFWRDVYGCDYSPVLECCADEPVVEHKLGPDTVVKVEPDHHEHHFCFTVNTAEGGGRSKVLCMMSATSAAEPSPGCFLESPTEKDMSTK